MNIMLGRPPLRDDERRRANKDPYGGFEKVNISEIIQKDVVVPEADPDWHAIAFNWFESLKGSAQALLYEPSDWSTAFLIADQISRELKPQFVGMRTVGENGEQEATYATIPMKGASLGAYLKAMSSLMTMEGDRRKLRLEVNRAEAAQKLPEGVTSIADGRRANAGV